MARLAGVFALMLMLLANGAPAVAQAKIEAPPVEITDDSVRVSGETQRTLANAAAHGSSSVANVEYEQATGTKVEWSVREINCSTSWAQERCGEVRFECTNQAAGEAPRVWVYSLAGQGGSWSIPSCSTSPPAPPALDAPQGMQAPPTPSLAQIQQAFRELPFCKPEPVMQPVGGKTLINLPTYFRASWPQGGACLTPGEISDTVQLLSWRIDFQVEAQDYRYSYGDGETSGWTTSTGGAYPDGDITHTYTGTGTREVRVDARLTGSYRVNGGDWQDIDTVADLQDEPAVTYEVVATRTRLHAATDEG
jgi:hypothetical protein